MDPAGLRVASDPAGSGASSPPPPTTTTTKELGRAVAAEASCGSRAAVGLGDMRVGISDSSDRAKSCLHPCDKKDTPQVTAEVATRSEDGEPSLLETGSFLQPEAACLTLGQLNPFFPYKKLGQTKVSDPSECGSTTGAVGESESHRKWREMKQNGFLSSSQGTAVGPRPRGRPIKRKRDDESKRNTFAQKEQTNKFMKVAAPSGLLSGLNPGIINHVRNSKQVYSIIKAMVHSENLEKENQAVHASQTGERGREFSEKAQDQRYGGNMMNCHFLMKGSNMPFHQGLPTASQFLPEDGDDLKLQLSSAVTMASDRTCSTSADDFASNHDYMTVLSVKAANVASQWLELLQQDIRGRLAALKRSKKRVRNALQTELPYLISTEFSYNQENEPSVVHSSDGGSTGKTVPEAHVARWRSLFLQMDRTLQEEGMHLENRLKEVQEMQMNCEKGLRYMACEAPLVGPMAELWKLKNSETPESEWAVQAAAASIYSTCNLVMRTENPGNDLMLSKSAVVCAALLHVT
uniref:Uncharacterized protein n=1 Tax=Oryza nivara TaxID=4536 RepID=A0A0E0G0N4_ORYNI